MPWPTMQRSRSWMVLWRPMRPSRTNTHKRCRFHYRRMEYKSRKSTIPGATGKFGLGIRNEAGQRLTEFCQENALVIANTLFQQHKRRLCTWTSTDGQHRNQIDYILYSQRWRSSIHSAKQDQELTVAQIMSSVLPNSDLNWRKKGKPLDYSGMTKIKCLTIIQWKWQIDSRDKIW